MVKRVLVLIALFESASALLSGAAFGAAQAPPGPPVPGPEQVQADDAANEAAARLLGVPLRDILACRKAGYGLFFSMVHSSLALETGAPVDEINEARAEGYSWGEICEAWGVSLENVIGRVEKAFSAMVREGHPPLPDTPDEFRRAISTGQRQKPARRAR